MAGLFKARLQIISSYICIKIAYAICCKIMEGGKLKKYSFSVMEMPTCKEKGERGSTLGGGGRQRRGRDIARCLQTPTTRRRRWRGEMQKWIQLGCKRTRAALFNSLPDAVWKSAHRGETKASQSLPYTHSNTAQRTREVLLRLALFSRRVFPGNWRSLRRQWKSTESSSVFQTTPTYGIDILTTLRGGKLKINI